MTEDTPLALDPRDLDAAAQHEAYTALLNELHDLRSDVGPDRAEDVQDLFIGALAVVLAETEQGQAQWRRALQDAEDEEFQSWMRRLQAQSEAIAAHAQATADIVDLPEEEDAR